MSRSNPRKRLRELLASRRLIVAPGIYDAYGARLVEQAGFGAVYMTGNGVSASLLGRPDVGLVTYASDSVLLFLGDGRGSFPVPRTFPASDTTAIVIRDFNEDGHADLATIDVDVDDVNILLGDGLGGFAAPLNFNSGGIFAEALAVGDFDGDGHADLAVASLGGTGGAGSGINVLLGEGNGNFGSPTNFAAGNTLSFVAVGDFNGDGRTDLAHMTTADYINIWLSRPDGTFSVSAHQPWPGYNVQSGSWQVGDFNGDGRSDLAHLSQGDYITVWQSQANGSFSLSPHNPWPGYWVQSGSWLTADFNGDDRSDLIHLTAGDFREPEVDAGE